MLLEMRLLWQSRDISDKVHKTKHTVGIRHPPCLTYVQLSSYTTTVNGIKVDANIYEYCPLCWDCISHHARQAAMTSWRQSDVDSLQAGDGWCFVYIAVKIANLVINYYVTWSVRSLLLTADHTANWVDRHLMFNNQGGNSWTTHDTDTSVLQEQLMRTTRRWPAW